MNENSTDKTKVLDKGQVERIAEFLAGEDLSVEDVISNDTQTRVREAMQKADQPTELVPESDEATTQLTPEQQESFLSTLQARFQSQIDHYQRPDNIDFAQVKKSLEARPDLMWNLAQLENTGGEVDIIDCTDDVFLFADCSHQSPSGRRSLNADQAKEQAEEFGVPMMSKEQYKGPFQNLEGADFDSLTWSWLHTPDGIRQTGRALLGRRRYGDVYVDRAVAGYCREAGGWRAALEVPKVS